MPKEAVARVAETGGRCFDVQGTPCSPLCCPSTVMKQTSGSRSYLGKDMAQAAKIGVQYLGQLCICNCMMQVIMIICET